MIFFQLMRSKLLSFLMDESLTIRCEELLFAHIKFLLQTKTFSLVKHIDLLLQCFINIMIKLEKAQSPQRKLSDLSKINRSRSKINQQLFKVTNSKKFANEQKVGLDKTNFAKPQVRNYQLNDHYKNRYNIGQKMVAINNSLNFAAFNLVQKDRETENSQKKSPKILKRDLSKSGNKSLPILKHQTQYPYQQSRIQFLKAALSGPQNIQQTQKSKSRPLNKNKINITAQQKSSFMTQAYPTQILTGRKLYERIQRKTPEQLRDSGKHVFSEEIKQIVKQSLNDIEIERLVKKRQEGNRSIFSFRQKEAFIQKMKKIISQKR